MADFRRGRSGTKLHLAIFGIAVVVLALSTCIILAAIFLTPSKDHPPEVLAVRWGVPSSSKTGTYSRAAISSEAAACAEVGKEILSNGGSAVDAAIAATLCGSIHHPQSAGIGGGSFMTIYNSTTDMAEVFNFREVAPLASTESMFANDANLSLYGGLAIAVPGEIAGYYAAWRRYGRVEWRSLFNRTIHMCEEGIAVNAYVSDNLNLEASRLVKNPAFVDEFFHAAGNTPLFTGERLRRPRLARTLRIIADEPEALYSGSLADDLVKDIADTGGVITREDLAAYRVLEQTPLRIPIGSGNWTLIVPQPPSSGVILAHILKVLSGYNFTGTSLSAAVKDVDKSSTTLHQIVESFKFAFGQRLNLGDPTFVNLTEVVSNLVSTDYAASVRARITDGITHNATYYVNVTEASRSDGTLHTSVVDTYGQAVSITSTINTSFGSKKMGNRTGIIFNNEMDDFSTSNGSNYNGFPPSQANAIKPGKRPLSSMCPVIVLDGEGKVRLVVGAGGGARIITATAWTIINHLFLGKSIKESVDRPRLHHQLLPEILNYEEEVPQEYLRLLSARGHALKVYGKRRPGFVQGIARQDGVWHAFSDHRKQGGTAGY